MLLSTTEYRPGTICFRNCMNIFRWYMNSVVNTGVRNKIKSVFTVTSSDDFRRLARLSLRFFSQLLFTFFAIPILSAIQICIFCIKYSTLPNIDLASLPNTFNCQINKEAKAAIKTVTIKRQATIASVLLHPWFSSHLHIGCIIIAINSPKNNGMKSVFPKYKIAELRIISSRYLIIKKNIFWVLCIHLMKSPVKNCRPFGFRKPKIIRYKIIASMVSACNFARWRNCFSEDSMAAIFCFSISVP